MPVLSDDVWCAYIALWFPSVVTRGIAFPFDEILQGSAATMATVLFDPLNFKLFFSINQIRRRPCVVRSMCTGFVIGTQ